MAEKPEDFNLPNGVVTKIIKDALPEGINVSKEAKAALSRAASIFVLYTTSCANNFALKAKRKTLSATDVLAALKDMELEKFIEPLKESLEMYRSEKSKKEKSSEGKKKRSKSKKDEKMDEGGREKDESDEEESEEEDANDNVDTNNADEPME